MVGSPNTLVNLVSRRVRQLNSGGGTSSRPLLLEYAGMGVADIALTEICEGKMGWEAYDESTTLEISPKKRKKS